MDWEDTIVGPATLPGSGCTAIVRLSGSGCPSILERHLVPTVPPLSFRKSFARRATLRVLDWRREVECSLYGWPAGKSYTGQLSAELHLPPSPPLLSAVECQCIAAGARLARPGEFTLRSFLSGRLDLAQAEGVLGLIEADNLADLHAAIDQRAGGVSSPITELRADLLDLLADVEAGLDFVEEDITFVSPEQLVARLARAENKLHSLEDSLRHRALEREVPVVLLVGPPNAGKSSLFNALAGARHAIVSPVAGTTRDALHATVSIGNRMVEFVDSAGIECQTDDIARQSAEQRERAARGADLILECIPIDQRREPATRRIAPPTLLARTKHDLDPGRADPAADVHVSAATGSGLSRLLELIADRLDATHARGRDGGAKVTSRVRASLEAAREDLISALHLARQGAGQEYVAMTLRETLDHLGEIVGATYTDDLLDRVFSRFCIGK